MNIEEKNNSDRNKTYMESMIDKQEAFDIDKALREENNCHKKHI